MGRKFLNISPQCQNCAPHKPSSFHSVGTIYHCLTLLWPPYDTACDRTVSHTTKLFQFLSRRFHFASGGYNGAGIHFALLLKKKSLYLLSVMNHANGWAFQYSAGFAWLAMVFNGIIKQNNKMQTKIFVLLIYMHWGIDAFFILLYIILKIHALIYWPSKSWDQRWQV